MFCRWDRRLFSRFLCSSFASGALLLFAVRFLTGLSPLTCLGATSDLERIFASKISLRAVAVTEAKASIDKNIGCYYSHVLNAMTSSSLNIIRSTTTVRYRRSYSNFIGFEIPLRNTEEWRLPICVTENITRFSHKGLEFHDAFIVMNKMNYPKFFHMFTIFS